MSQFTEADSSVNRLNAAVTAFEKVLTEPEGTVVEMPTGAAQPSLSERLKRAIDAVTVKPAQAAAQATASAQQAQAAQQSAAQSAADAANSAAATGYVAPPFPDVWAPLNDDLRLLAGFAPADTIPGTSYTLPTKSMTFTRSTIATLFDKSGVLRTAAVNEPRFESEGLLMEGQSTNYILNSDDPSKWSGTSGSITKTTLAADGTSQAVTMKGVINTSTTFPTMVLSSTLSLVAGDNLTISCRAKGAYGYIRLAFTLEGSTIAATLIEAATGIALSPPAGVTVTSQIGSDGYVTIAATLTAGSAGNYAGVIAVQKISADSTIPLNTEYYVQMPQVEKNPIATSYIPTGAAAVTRASDSISLQPSGNVGYRTIGDQFNRTIAFEIAINKYVTPNVGYAEIVRTLGANNDIILRAVSATINSYIGGSGPSIAVTYPFASQVYAQTIEASNVNTIYFDGKSNSRTLPPTTPGSTPTVLNFLTNSGIVYHIRNFRIWHRLLTPTQIRGLR